MKSTYAQIISASLLGLASAFQISAKTAKHPNIVVIFVDDMGYGDLSSTGATLYKTPNLDKLAAEGMRFTNFMAAQAVSSASRAGLLTGCYPNRVGIWGALSPKSEFGLNPDEETIAEILKASSYKTAAIGKWHLGDSNKFMPLSQGFDEYLGLPYSNDMWPLRFKEKPFYPELPLIDGYNTVRIIKNMDDQSELTTLYTERAIQFIEKNKKRPFFLYLAHSMPHVPLAVSSKFKGKSEQGMYGDVLMEIDWSVGEIMKFLKKKGLEKNTLVIFTSDNGPWIKYGNHAGSTGGLREGKGVSMEGGQRVPCIMKWPGNIPAGTICNKLSSTIDILPTLAAITQSPLPKKKIDGVNILPLLLGNENVTPRDTFLYYYKRNSLEAVRLGQWKLVLKHEGLSYTGFLPGNDGESGKSNYHFIYEEQLFDLRRDQGECYDVKEMYPEIVAKLQAVAEKAREDLGDDILNIPGANRREPGYLTRE